MTPNRLFYGWIVVAASAAIVCIGMGALFALGVFLEPMADTMGWSRGAISSVALLNWMAMGLGSFVWGSLSDRIGARAVAVAGGVLLGLGLVLSSQAQALWQLAVSFGVMVGFAVGAFYAPLTSTATKWFTARRGLAVALVSSGIGVGILTIAPLARALISLWDWRVALLVLGDLAWLVIVPAALLIRERPGDVGAAALGGAARAGREYSTGEVVATPQFWAIALTHFACCAAHSGPIFHMVSNAIDHGVTAMAAATVLSAASLASLSGKIICGLVADRVGAKRTLIAGLALQAVAISLYLGTRELATFYAVALVFGFAYGGVMPLYAILVREYFGERIMGTVFGAVAFVSTLGMALGPWAGGWLYDTFGGYFWLFLGSFGIGLGAVAIAFTFRVPQSVPAALPSPSAAR
ncbi:MAG: MFS transporter [Candidatus Rokuibacteriota bacterium]|nr:MAG: MFS transporter [Candidatus Rokubacteria bacterium]